MNRKLQYVVAALKGIGVAALIIGSVFGVIWLLVVVSLAYGDGAAQAAWIGLIVMAVSGGIGIKVWGPKK